MDLIGKDLIDFELPYVGEKGLERAKLSESAENSTVLLLFFPAAWTGVCTKEVCYIRDNIQDFNDLNTTVFAISVDLPWALNKYKEDFKLNFTLLSDANRDVIKAYDIVWSDLGGIKDTARRSAFIISNGKITYSWKAEKSQGEFPPFDEIKEKLTG